VYGCEIRKVVKELGAIRSFWHSNTQKPLHLKPLLNVVKRCKGGQVEGGS